MIIIHFRKTNFITIKKLNLFRLINPDKKLFDNEMKLEVKFPMTVEKKHVDILIKSDIN